MVCRTEQSLNKTFRYLAPHEQLRTLVWCMRHARDVDGEPYQHDRYPHLGAPGGPCDALDDPRIRKIWLQFASRLGKTFLGQSAAIKKADCDPGPMMFASSVEKTASEVVERTYKQIEKSPRVSHQLRPQGRRRQDVIDFDACQCFIAWSRSSSTLADKELEFGHGNEIDKWEQLKTSKEADPLKLFLDRFKNRPHHKVILESTPTVKDKSRVEAGRLQSTNCQFNVPCPHCARYQVATLDGIDWESPPEGRSDKELARRTAVYLCEFCEEEIHDHHRPTMMRLGVWCPEGCKVKDAEARAAAERCPTDDYEWTGWANADWIEGTPLRDGPEAGYQLSSLYALSLGWGDIAAEFVSCKGKPQDLRNFVNSWLAQTWATVKQKTDWEKLGLRIISADVLHDVVPTWASLLTAAVDRQGEGEPRFPWAVDAWGPNDRNATICYGQARSFAEVDAMLGRRWSHADGGPSLALAFSLVDSGNLPKGVIEFCLEQLRKGRKVLPCKGASHPMDCDYRVSIQGPKTSMPGMELVLVDTVRTQMWIDGLLHDPNTVYSLYAAAVEQHQDFLEQLLNDAESNDLDRSNNVRTSYKRVNTGKPNDYRDVRRYSYIARLLATSGRPISPRLVSASQPAPPEETPPARVRKLNIRR